jgi:hypothetical protein
MVDNLYPDGGSDELRRSDAGGLSRNPPMADREVPLEGGRPTLIVQQWLDGEATEAAARRADAQDVELWQRITEEAERRRRMTTPAPVLDRIMAAIPEAAPVEPLAWWKRSVALSLTAAVVGGAALVGLGVAIGAMMR